MNVCIYSKTDGRMQANLLGHQGEFVFHNAQEMEEFAGAITEIPERDGDFLTAAQTEEIDGRVDRERLPIAQTGSLPSRNPP